MESELKTSRSMNQFNKHSAGTGDVSNSNQATLAETTDSKYANLTDENTERYSPQQCSVNSPIIMDKNYSQNNECGSPSGGPGPGPGPGTGTVGASSYNNLFGDPLVSPRRAGKIYHMSSDIFGIGSIVDREGQHVGNRPLRKEGKACVAASREKIFGTSPADPNSISRVQSFQNLAETPASNLGDYIDKKPNARENGCNPVTGDGYAEGDPGKTQKRQYPSRGRSQSLW